MGRIDEALRRGIGLSADRSASGLSAVDVFVSPWAVGGEVGEQRVVAPGPAEEEAAARTLPEAHAQPVERSSALERFKTDLGGKLVVSATPDSLLVDQFRRLAGTLLHNPDDLKTVMITSASPGDGKTLTSLNLALVLSESYRRRVLLIEGDLRRPAIAHAAGIRTEAGGLSEVLRAHDDRKVALVPVTGSLTLMPAGRPDSDPLSGLTSPRFKQILEEASEQYDWVILDTPPIGAAPDASLMLPLVDAALLVIRARITPHAVIQRAIAALGADRILGVVLNAVGPDVVAEHEHYYYSDYSKA